MRKILFILALLIAESSISAPVRAVMGAKMVVPEKSKTATYTAADYIQDGLIAMWDGIENAGWGIHDDSATNWVDLTGNELDLTISTNAHFSGKSLMRKDNTTLIMGGWAFKSNVQKTIASLGGIGTTEIIADDIPRYGGQVLLLVSTYVNCPAEGLGNTYTGCGWRAHYSNADTRWFGVNAGAYQLLEDKPYKLRSFSYSRISEGCKLLIDGRDQSTGGAVGSGPYIGGGGQVYNDLRLGAMTSTQNVYLYNGNRICNVRLYNRVLTNDEIQYNWKIDKVRFNLSD